MARCRWFEEDFGSEVVFRFVAHVHDRTPLLILLRRYGSILSFRLVDHCDVLLAWLQTRTTGAQL